MKRSTKRIIIPLAAIAALLAFGEALVRVTDIDWRLTEKSLYYQKVDLAAHQAVSDPILMYRLRPGRYHIDSRVVTVNSLGFRGPEYTREKPAGVFRVICVGGSNVYGGNLGDGETWPEQLETELRRTHATPIEVWNLGVSAYVGVQIAKMGREALDRYNPDAMIVDLTMGGMRPFLKGAPVKPYFDNNPRLWFDLVIPPVFDNDPGDAALFAVRHFRLYRLAMMTLGKALDRRRMWMNRQEGENIRSVREFLQEAGSRTQVGIFLPPSVNWEIKDYYRGLYLPVLHLKATGLPEEFADIHPPVKVMTWYAQKIAEWMGAAYRLPPLK